MYKGDVWEDEVMSLEERGWIDYLKEVELPEYEGVVQERTYGVMFEVPVE